MRRRNKFTDDPDAREARAVIGRGPREGHEGRPGEYADLRGNVVYGMGNAKTPDELKASRIGSCLVKGQFPYPFTDDGVPMVAGMVICRP